MEINGTENRPSGYDGRYNIRWVDPIEKDPSQNPTALPPSPQTSSDEDYVIQLSPDGAARSQETGSGAEQAATEATGPREPSPEAPGEKEQSGRKDKDNGKDGDESQSAKGTEESKDPQKNKEIQQQIQKLKAREQEVIAHEQAHKSAGGQYAGAPSYEYTKGPDGKSYISGGEVSIDASQEKDPEATIRKMRQIRSAALAPAQPSSQDQNVAAKASQAEMQAQAELARQTMEKAKGGEDEKQEAGKKGAVTEKKGKDEASQAGNQEKEMKGPEQSEKTTPADPAGRTDAMEKGAGAKESSPFARYSRSVDSSAGKKPASVVSIHV